MFDSSALRSVRVVSLFAASPLLKIRFWCLFSTGFTAFRFGVGMLSLPTLAFGLRCVGVAFVVAFWVEFRGDTQSVYPSALRFGLRCWVHQPRR